MRRVLIILGIVIVAIALIAAVYFLFFAPKGTGITARPSIGNPFGESPDASGDGTSVTGDIPSGAGDEVAPSLIRITQGPVAFGSLASTTSETITTPGETASSAPKTSVVNDTLVRYVERTTGNVYEYRLGKRSLTRLSNRTLPGVQEASWVPDGSMAFVRFLSADADGVDTYALPAMGDDGYFLESNLSQVLVSGSSTLVTLLPSSAGSIATVAKSNGTGAKTLFSSLLSMLHLSDAGRAGYAAQTYASAQTDGFGFLVSTSGTFERVLGPLRGLTLLPSPTGKSVLYSSVSGNSVRSAVLDVASRTSTTLPIGALPEKCVWTADESAVYCAVPRAMSGTWPDSWYQGAVSFSDRIWKIDMTARVAVLVVDTATVAKVDVDAVSLTIDKKSDALIFTNKKDGSLWLYDL